MTQRGSGRTWRTDSPEATFALGEALGHSLVGGIVIGLIGPLGAGKTQLVKGIAAGNAADKPYSVTSPTFTLIHEYPGRISLYHVDVYRLTAPSELTALGFDELIRPDTAVVVEWADLVRQVMPDDVLWADLAVRGESCRSLDFTAIGDLATRCLDDLTSAYR